MGNAQAKDGGRCKGAEVGVGYAGDGVLLYEEARGKGSMIGSSALHDMLAQGQHPSTSTNVVSRYQQMSRQAGQFGEGQGWSNLEGMHAPATIDDLSFAAASALQCSSGATSHPSSVSASQAMSQVSFCTANELGQPWMHPSQNDLQIQNQIATLIEWKYGGSDVLLEGSWDNWHTRTPLQRAGKDFTLLKFLPAGVYHYRFLVDGNWRHAPDVPFMFDEKGNGFINVLDVQSCALENLDGVVDFEAPGSPDSSYDNPFPGPEDFSKDPPLLPLQHVILNHLFVEIRKAASSPVLTLGFTQRFRGKYTTVILHKPIRR